MHLEYQALLQEDPELDARLKRLPGAVFSARKRPSKGALGVFFCYALPALDKEAGEFTEAAGTTRWYLYDLKRDAILEEPGEIIGNIRSKRDTPRNCTTPREDARRYSQEGRSSYQEFLSEARRRTSGRDAGSQVLDGAQRGLNRCRPTTVKS